MRWEKAAGTNGEWVAVEWPRTGDYVKVKYNKWFYGKVEEVRKTWLGGSLVIDYGNGELYKEVFPGSTPDDIIVVTAKEYKEQSGTKRPSLKKGFKYEGNDAKARAALALLSEYLAQCGLEAGRLKGWYVEIGQRKEGKTKGTSDLYYISPNHEKFRSKVGVARHFGLVALPSSTKPASAMSTTSMAHQTNTMVYVNNEPRIEDSPAPFNTTGGPPSMTTALTSPTAALVLPLFPSTMMSPTTTTAPTPALIPNIFDFQVRDSAA